MEQAPEDKFENLHGRDRVTLYSVSRCIFTVVIKEKNNNTKYIQEIRVKEVKCREFDQFDQIG